MNAPTPPCEIPSASGGRRDFLTILAGITALSVVPLAAGFASRRRKTLPGGLTEVPPTTALPDLASFVPHIGSSFIAVAAGSRPAVPFTLAEAEAHQPRHSDAGESFSLLFAAPEGHVIASCIYQLQHPALGSLELFISPVGSADRFGEAQKGEAIIYSAIRLS